VLLELRELDTTKYGGWISAVNGKVHYVEDGETHQDVANRLGAGMPEIEDYAPAYAMHLVRFVQNMPASFELSGELEDVKKTFKLWWPTASKSYDLWIDLGVDGTYLSFNMLEPRERNAARKQLGPQLDEREVWDTPSKNKTSKELTPEKKAAAKARAERAGRAYPNLIDNMWASKR
jgi:hypothetical protein